MIKKIIIGLSIFLVFVLGVTFFGAYLFYKSIFRLSENEVLSLLKDNVSRCQKFSECKLIEGDIIIRRYVTPTTKTLDFLFNPYFTHSAVYLGNNEIFEAVGNTVPVIDQISVNKLSETDWFNDDMKNFVVIRPRDYFSKFEEIKEKLVSIADDPEYIFMPLDETKKTASCSDIIFKNLSDQKIIDGGEMPQFLLPDYLFWTIVSHENFEIYGYNIIN
jgi:hypothetical protein